MAGNSTKTPAKRGRKFTKAESAKGGRTGGGGRPSNDARAQALKYGAGCFPMLGKIVKNAKADPRDRINAAKVLLGYAHGQPTAVIEATLTKWLVE